MRWRASVAALPLASALASALTAALTAGAQAAPPAPPPGAVETFSERRARDAFSVPVRAFGGDAPVNARIEGALTLQTLRIAGDVSSLSVALDYRARLEAEGFRTVLFCAAPDCGGFDFRAALSVLPQPAMRVDLIDFHQLTLRRETAQGADWVAVLTSRSGGAAHAQVVTLEDARPAAPETAQPETAAVAAPEAAPPAPSPDAAPQDTAPPAPAPPAPAPPGPAPAPPPSEDPGALLDRDGHAALDGVAFRTGSTEIAPGSEAVLDRAAAALAARGGRDFVVVGHTDSAGALDLNRRISAQRAEAVRAALIARGAPAARLSAEGAGWLAPRALNDTEAGRARNRRVEIIAR